MRPTAICLLAVLLMSGTVSAETPGDGPAYDSEGRLQYPASYREWIYLTTGIDMTYADRKEPPAHSMFDNVFVNPSSYRAFLATGTWPDKTMLVIEVRGAGTKGSINKAGKYQTSDMMGLEVHVKDKRFDGNWGFFGFDGQSSQTVIPKAAPCYSCHEAHAAVDTTFVQFYPTLLGIAKDKGTLSPAYLKDEQQAGAK